MLVGWLAPRSSASCRDLGRAAGTTIHSTDARILAAATGVSGDTARHRLAWAYQQHSRQRHSLRAIRVCLQDRGPGCFA